MATIEEQVKALKKEKDYCCTQCMFQIAGLDSLGLADDVCQKALRALGWGVRTQTTCGAITGAAMALSLHIDDKKIWHRPWKNTPHGSRAFMVQPNAAISWAGEKNRMAPATIRWWHHAFARYCK